MDRKFLIGLFVTLLLSGGLITLMTQYMTINSMEYQIKKEQKEKQKEIEIHESQIS
jgi:hypothetical protein